MSGEEVRRVEKRGGERRSEEGRGEVRREEVRGCERIREERRGEKRR